MDRVLEEIENAEKNGISLDDIIIALNDKRNKDKKKTWLLSIQKKREELIDEIAYGIAYEFDGAFNIQNVNEMFYIIYVRTLLNEVAYPIERNLIVWKTPHEHKIDFVDDDFKCQKCCKKHSFLLPIYYNIITKDIYCDYDREIVVGNKHCANICTYLPELMDVVKTNLMSFVKNGYKKMDIKDWSK